MQIHKEFKNYSTSIIADLSESIELGRSFQQNIYFMVSRFIEVHVKCCLYFSYGFVVNCEFCNLISI